MKRTLIEVVLALAMVGAGVFGWLNWQKNQKNVGQLTALQAASDAAAAAATKTLQTSGASAKAAEEQAAALRQQLAPMEAQLQELAAAKAGLKISGISRSLTKLEINSLSLPPMMTAIAKPITPYCFKKPTNSLTIKAFAPIV